MEGNQTDNGNSEENQLVPMPSMALPESGHAGMSDSGIMGGQNGNSAMVIDISQSDSVQNLKFTKSIWSAYSKDELDESKARCLICNNKLFCGKGRNGTTTTMWNHLNRRHQCIYAEMKKLATQETSQCSQNAKRPKLTQQTLQQSLDSGKPWDKYDEKTTKINKAIAEMIVLDNQPFRMLENEGFLRLISALQPKYRIPHRRLFSEKLIPSMAAKVQTCVSELVSKAHYFSFTSDIWTCSVNNKSFISFTGHWIYDFEPKSVVLACSSFPVAHTGSNIASMIHRWTDDWKIDAAKIHLFLRDEGANMVKGISDAGYEGLSCTIHVLQSVIKDGIKSQRAVNDMISKARNIATHFGHSSKSCCLLIDIQKRLSLPEHKIVQDVPTRWNSTYYMLVRLLEQKEAVTAISSNVAITNLQYNEWKLLESLISLLAPFEVVTKQLSCDQSYASEVIPTVRLLENYLGKPAYSDEEKKKDLHAGVKTIKEELLRSLRRRFSTVEQNESLTIATALDPRYKFIHFKPATESSVKERLYDILKHFHIRSQGSSIAGSSTSQCHDFRNPCISNTLQNFTENSPQQQSQHAGMLTLPVTSRRISNSTTNCQSILKKSHDIYRNYHTEAVEEYNRSREVDGNTIDNDGNGGHHAQLLLVLKAELDLYNAAPTILEVNEEPETLYEKIKVDPVSWWKENQRIFPRLSVLVSKYFSAPASTICSERLFSEAGLIYEKKRNRLAENTAENLIFTQHNLRKLNFEY